MPKSFRLSYLTLPLPLLVFAVQRDQDGELVGKLFTQESTNVIKTALLSFLSIIRLIM